MKLFAAPAWAVLVAALAGLTLAAPGAPRIASAQEGEDARSLFMRGLEQADGERWGEAALLFERSMQLAPRASTHFNLGLAYVRLGRYMEAIEVLERFLAEVEEDNPSVPQGRQLLNEARASRATLRLEVVPPEAELRIDGRSIGEQGAARLIHLDPGPHVIELEADGYQSQSVRMRFPSGGEVETQIELMASRAAAASAPGTVSQAPSDPAPPAPVSGPALETSSDEDAGGGLLEDPIFWVLAAAVAVAVGVGVTVGVVLASEGDEPYAGTSGVAIRF